ncbi:NADH:quinone oxidoreductase I, membrane subunit J [Campylobacter ureolyticus RIGS 9880]|uniref:NADH-quinone oxidoreductase subunit J n=2 Tax=Campylobacter ureolyticus TaxID=827 RepID=A0A9Q4KPM1_9BACT|nr:NADH-quinone oxidoreductase subunit J [Campylobacter ureolyticus]AKT91401.1 NADH:quinone oxidoreductase I, membrane subunit J [Campylobacter ureolyticus RIGS 9880]MCZ6106099.1 NADH-quinone oxidoreductase subunit J [Campylobacter ureolyticus]MCZ6133713.1 NADH-quinone oxidoreductase subunit J [Campylobacter ureolyticus]MCZ6150867.1 NADH-quinone oxidoreductase subunit J [Campylobacter ureolyticus]MCZ6158704.1 NADH-quinone oxidoreductase subunit J [Campylobacter ureolyticus]
MIETIGFYFFSIMSIFLFAISVFSTKVLYSMSALAGGMIFISGLFFLLNAEFLGVIQILVYTGAVVVLYSFSMMFFDSNIEFKEDKKSFKIIFSLSIISAILLFIMILAPIKAKSLSSSYPIIEGARNTDLLGIILFTKYIVAFEICATLLLAAMICAIVLTHKEMDKKGDIL